MRLKILIFCTVVTKIAIAQVAPPTPYISGAKTSYIRTWDASTPEQNVDTLKNRDVQYVKQATQYVDGFGRPIQTVQKKISPNLKDMVVSQVYDEYGREVYKYLPYESTLTSAATDITNDGNFKLNAFQQQKTFSQDQYPGETYYYGQTNFEASPLNKILESFAPGNSWVGTAADTVINHHSIRVSYLTNSTADSVRIWTVNDFGSYTTGGIYAQGQLYKTTTFDEHSKQAVEFKDKEGNLILKRVQITDSVSDGHSGWLCTYYVYDEYNNLRLIIPPKAVELIKANSWNLIYNADVIKELCFQYEYDNRNRMIAKRVPGAGLVFMVYDVLDRVAMTRDSNSLIKDGLLTVGAKWQVTEYDQLNRPVRTGLWSSSTYDRASMQSTAGSAANYPAKSYLDTASAYEVLTETYYDNYDWVSGTTLSSSLDNSYTSNSSYFYTSINTAPDFAQSITQSNSTRGLITGSKVKVLGTNQYLYNVNFYDDKGRIIQTQSDNITGGIDIITAQFDWNGKVLRNLIQHAKSGANAQSHLVLTKMEYDHAGRLLKIKKTMSSTIGSNTYTTTEKTIVTNQYNNIGQLKNKIVGDSVSGITERLFHDYNIRGWLTGVNKEYIKDSINSHWFGYELGYDKAASVIGSTTYSAPEFNGNISGMIWKSAGDQEKRKNDYTYDNVNRLLSASFKQKFGSSWATTDPNNSNFTIDFSVDSLSYDANGNILKMQQKGLQINTSQAIDKMRYSYMNSGVSNRLLSVTEDGSIGTTENKLGDFTDRNTSDDDYAYDGNGNLRSDKNKGIDSIYYNHLNLPYRIRVNDSTGSLKGIIEYVYDAGGNKLEKKTTEGSTVTTTDYITGFVYQNDTLQFVSHEEGRIRLKGDTALFFDYFLKDHLGNVRMVLTEERQIDHYPTATLEPSLTGRPPTPLDQEMAYYDINDSYVVSVATKPDHINDNGTNNPNTFGDSGGTSINMLRLNGSTNPTGLSKILRVMAGDTINILGVSYYEYASGTVTNTAFTASNIISAFLGVMGGANAAVLHGATGTVLNNNTGGTVTPLTNFTNNNPVNSNNNVKAGINYIIFDEHFNYIDGGFDPVESSIAGGVKSHFLQNIVIPKNGFIYIYCSNESNLDVYFDNLEVIHSRGPILEETHYYPFGLTMAGISSKSQGSLINKKKYNSYELNTDLDINLDESFYRLHDPQIGRFWQLDPKPRNDEGTYNAMGDSPIKYADPFGDIYHVEGGSDDVKAYIKLLESVTGNKYKVDKNGNLVRTNKKLNKKTTDKISGTLSQNIDAAINSKETVSFKLVNDESRDKGITYDLYKTGEIDMKDLPKIKDNAFLAGILGHILEEHIQVPDISKRSSNNAEAKAAHNKGLIMEGQIVTEMNNVPNQARIESHSGILIFQNGPNQGEKTIEYYFDYGKVKYTERVGVTTTKGAEASNGVIYSVEKQ